MPLFVFPGLTLVAFLCRLCLPASCLQREFCRDLFYAANTTYNERAERLTLEEEIKINEVSERRMN